MVARHVEDVVSHRGHGDCAESASWVTGEHRNRLTRTSIALSSVAENSSRWPSRGVLEQTAYGRQEAEVGHVVGLVEDGDLDARASSGPDRSGPRAGRGRPRRCRRLGGALHLGVLADATEDGPGGEPGGPASGARACSIWPTSSRVGARMSARGLPAPVAAEATSRATSGSRKA